VSHDKRREQLLLLLLVIPNINYYFLLDVDRQVSIKYVLSFLTIARRDANPINSTVGLINRPSHFFNIAICIFVDKTV